MFFRAFCLALALFGLSHLPASADDWTAVKLRGRVLQLVDQQWLPLQRGDVVPDHRVVRTLTGARVEFHRDAEVIALGADTQIQIHDRAGKRFTTVTQYFGKVEIEANVENVEHFAVKTPFLAAVVKGTKFVVRSGKSSSRVDVLRGHVEVESESTHSSTLVGAGQSATVNQSSDLEVSGTGERPVVTVPAGQAASEAETAADALKAKNGKGNSGSNGKSGNDGAVSGKGKTKGNGSAPGGNNGNTGGNGKGKGNAGGNGKGSNDG